MATFSDGQFFSPSSNGLRDSVSSVVTTGDMRQHLQNLLDTKDRQVQQVATLGERVLQQRMELEEKIYQLRDLDVDRGDSDDINGETRLRYHDLANMLKSWEEENVQLAGTLGIEVRATAFFGLIPFSAPRYAMILCSPSCIAGLIA